MAGRLSPAADSGSVKVQCMLRGKGQRSASWEQPPGPPWYAEAAVGYYCYYCGAAACYSCNHTECLGIGGATTECLAVSVCLLCCCSVGRLKRPMAEICVKAVLAVADLPRRDVNLDLIKVGWQSRAVVCHQDWLHVLLSCSFT